MHFHLMAVHFRGLQPFVGARVKHNQRVRLVAQGDCVALIVHRSNAVRFIMRNPSV
jgi:hypothetical protein